MSCSCSASPSIPQASCGCGASPSAPAQASGPKPETGLFRRLAVGAAALFLWGAAYAAIEPLARLLSFDLLALEAGTPLGDAAEFFLYDTAKILLLLILMVYAVAWLRTGMRTDIVRERLAGRGRLAGYFLASSFGAITPFCSCSSIPLFVGFTTARIPVGVTMAFLVTSPVVNEVAVVLLWGVLGWKFTLAYVATGLGAGILGGAVMDAIHAERWLLPFVRETAPGGMGALLAGSRRAPGFGERHAFALSETRNIFRRVWKWVVAGVALGAALHGWAPQEWIAEHLGAGQWWSVPAAVILGIPLYANVTGIVPVMESLLLKGLPVGTTLAFCMSAVAASLPEMMMLKQVMRWRLLALFLGLLLLVFTLVGWLFNAVGPAFLLS